MRYTTYNTLSKIFLFLFLSCFFLCYNSNNTYGAKPDEQTLVNTALGDTTSVNQSLDSQSMENATAKKQTLGNLTPKSFKDPPNGYGEVPFWWWTGEKLNSNRLIHQLDELHKKGISGVQINYAHDDCSGWPTYPNDPEVFTESWWTIFDQVAAACRERKMGIGLSGYTLDWQNSPTNLYARIIYSDPTINSKTIFVKKKTDLKKGEALKETIETLDTDPNNTCIGVIAYPKSAEGKIHLSQLKALSTRGTLQWQADTEATVWFYYARREPNTINPLNPCCGKTVIEKFFQPFETRTMGKNHFATAEESGLNYFFQDELRLGTGNLVWHDDLPIEFQKRKNYELWEALPAMFGEDCGDRTEKYRLDFMDVRVRLAEERYFIPIFKWHNVRNMIYGCDSAGRGRNPNEFGDYFSAVRWYTAPGHDTPGGQADFIKNKVSSSIAHFYKRPRVWLEGYHSFGWGATPEQLLFATNENFLFGANLLNLHGLYYTTYGAFWEWAPPCYHFRMPWWNHFDTFLKYFERLSYSMTRGVQQVDLVILYPVSPGQAGVAENRSVETAFRAASQIYETGRDLLFIDDNSLALSKVHKGELSIADSSHHILVLPAMTVIRWASLQKALEFYRNGGTIIALGALPNSSDHAGKNDKELNKSVHEIFGVFTDEASNQKTVSCNKNTSGGRGIFIPCAPNKKIPDPLLIKNVLKAEPLDVYNYRDSKPLKIHHRRTPDQDIYMVMGAEKGSPITFRASGRTEIWNCWNGEQKEISTVIQPTSGSLAGTTTVYWPYRSKEAALIVFKRKEKPSLSLTSLETNLSEIIQLKKKDNNQFTISGYVDKDGPWFVRFEYEGKKHEITGIVSDSVQRIPVMGDWTSNFIPTMDNQFGDFRLPIEENIIGPEAQRFEYCETSTITDTKSSLDNSVSSTDNTDDTGSIDNINNRSNQDKELPIFDGKKILSGFGQKFWKLGPLPSESDWKTLDRQLSQLSEIDPQKPIMVNGKEYHWAPYSFSWRFGIEGNPGHQGYHGLKEKLDNRFIGLGKSGEALNETTFIPEEAGSIYYLWTTVKATFKEAKQSDKQKSDSSIKNNSSVFVVTEGKEPNSIYLAGKELTKDNTNELIQGKSTVPLLLRYNQAGRYAFCLTTTAKSEAKRTSTTPLSMKWYNDPGLLDFDVWGNPSKPVCWYRFQVPGGLVSMSIKARGSVEFYIDGKKVDVESVTFHKDESLQKLEKGLFSFGSNLYKVRLPKVNRQPVSVIMKAIPFPGQYGGNLISEPVKLECETGFISLGDWNTMGVLETYSGMIRYSKEFELTSAQLKNRITLDLGRVSASCQVFINGENMGKLVTSPWTIVLDKKVLKSGSNHLEVTVANTLSNYYSTVPSRYKGNTSSGLFGPVQLVFEKPVP